jgi:hypothetical protein
MAGQRMKRHVFAATLVMSATVVIAGCAGGLGSKRYGCSGLPSHPLCLSTSEVYELTNQPGPPPAERALTKERGR